MTTTMPAAMAEPTTTTTTTTAMAATNAIVETVKSIISSTTTTTTHAGTTTRTTSAVPSLGSAATATAAKLSVKDLSSSLQHFGIADYFVFVAMLASCAFIGFYFGFIEKKQKHKQSGGTNSPVACAGEKDGAGVAGAEERRGSEALDYLVGGRKMKVFPVSLSLVASFVSGISLLGTSTEIYVYGTQYAFLLITLAVSGIISWYIFLPVFCNLQLTSTYEYFELRFDRKTRLLGSLLFTFGTLVWLPIVIYVPALAFNQVTGINIHIITPVVCIVCIFYTTVGGLKAVVWTDVIQTIIMVGAIFFVIVKGTIDVGGLGVVLQRNYDSGRLEWPEMTLDHKVRISMFAMLGGNVPYLLQVLGGNQVIIQRYLSLPGLQQVKQASIWFIVGVTLLNAICLYNGLLLFATYYDCDPLTTKLASAKDQLVPLLVMDALSSYPGIPGMFVAGVFSAALSSLSTGLNSLAAVILEDYIKPLVKTALTEYQTAVIMRVSTLSLGTLCVILVFVVERMGTHVMQLSMTMGSVAVGPLLGLFLMGLLMPKVNAKSAFFGTCISFVFTTYICLRAQVAINAGELQYDSKPMSTAGCDYQFELPLMPANATKAAPTTLGFAQQIYHMSFMFYGTAGALIGIISGQLAGLIFGRNPDNEVDIELLAPCVRRFYKCNYISVQLEEKLFSASAEKAPENPEKS